jgi:hypothetical protein
MQIDNAAISMASQHQFRQERQSSLAMRFWVGNNQPPPLSPSILSPGQEGAQRPLAPPPRPPLSDELSISPQARSLMEKGGNVAESGGMKDAADMVDDPVMRMVVMLLQKVLGKKFRVYDAQGEAAKAKERVEGQQQAQPDPSTVEQQGWGFELRMEESYYESEQMSFAAQGVINTKDGRSIQFELQLAMSREYFTQSSVHITLGDALQDPLVVNFDGTAAQLTDQRFNFDLTSDGQEESIHFLKPGSGFLAIDKDGDGQITQGRELFGPTTGDGFRELRAYDEDGNGWIDANDSVYARLGILVHYGDRQQLYSLKEKGIGAIYLNAIDSPFTIKNSQNETLAQVAQSSLFLKENGEVGTVQRIDLAT